MKIGDTAPDFEAQTTDGRIRFHDWIGEFVGRFIFAPERLHPGLHDRARIHGENKATVRPEKCKDHRLIGRFDGRSRRMGEGHPGNSGSRAKLPDHRGCRFQCRKTLWDAPR